MSGYRFEFASRYLCCFTFMALAGCGGGGSDSNSGQSAASTNSPAVAAYLDTQVAANLHIFSEIGETRALQVTDSVTGNVFTLSGTRDSVGALVTAKHLSVVQSGVTTDTTYINSTDRKITIGSDASITMTYSGGAWSMNYVDLTSGNSLKTSLPSTVPVSASRARALSTSPDGSTTDNQIPVNVTTQACGVQMDAISDVGVTLNGSTGAFLGSYPATRMAPGQYTAYIPNTAVKGAVSLDYIKTVLETANTSLGILCDADKASPLAGQSVCGTLTALAVKLAPGMASAIFKTCEAGIVAFKATCTGKDYIGLPIPTYVDGASKDLTKDLADIIINAIPESLKNASVVGYINMIPFNITGAAAAISASTSSVSLLVNDESPTVGDIVITPPNPAAGTSYTASAPLQCIPFSSTASLFVTGTDGYTNSNSKSFPVSVTADSISLQVPGSNAGEQDTIDLSFQARTLNAPITRTAYVVFQ